MTLPLGFLPHLSADDYHARELGLVSKSALDQLHRSPAHYLAWVNGERSKTTEAMAFGRAGHCAIFEPEAFAARYIEQPDFGDQRFKENKLRKQAWLEENPDREPLDPDEMRRLHGVQASIHRHDLIRRLLSRGIGESTVSWVDAETELRCKSRADYYVESLATVVDLKLVEDASFDGFRKSIARYRYFVQDALYRAGFAAVGKPIEHFVFVAIEKEAPFASAIYALDADGVSRGHTAAREGLAEMRRCLKENKWPGYPAGIQTVDLPPWAA